MGGRDGISRCAEGGVGNAGIGGGMGEGHVTWEASH